MSAVERPGTKLTSRVRMGFRRVYSVRLQWAAVVPAVLVGVARAAMAVPYRARAVRAGCDRDPSVASQWAMEPASSAEPPAAVAEVAQEVSVDPARPVACHL